MPIKAIAFDVGNVILKWDYAPAFALYAKHCPHSPENIKVLLWEKLIDEFDTGVHDEAGFFRAARKVLSLDKRIGQDKFLSAWNNIFEYNHAIEALIDSLPAHVDKLLLSNTNPLHYQRAILELPVVLKHFANKHHHVLSFDVGAIKPDLAIYQALLVRARHQPEEIVFVDDMPENIKAWQKLGGSGIQYNAKVHDINYLRAELQKAGVLCDKQRQAGLGTSFSHNPSSDEYSDNDSRN